MQNKKKLSSLLIGNRIHQGNARSVLISRNQNASKLLVGGFKDFDKDGVGDRWDCNFKNKQQQGIIDTIRSYIKPIKANPNLKTDQQVQQETARQNILDKLTGGNNAANSPIAKVIENTRQTTPSNPTVVVISKGAPSKGGGGSSSGGGGSSGRSPTPSNAIPLQQPINLQSTQSDIPGTSVQQTGLSQQQQNQLNMQLQAYQLQQQRQQQAQSLRNDYRYSSFNERNFYDQIYVQPFGESLKQAGSKVLKGDFKGAVESLELSEGRKADKIAYTEPPFQGTIQIDPMTGQPKKPRDVTYKDIEFEKIDKRDKAVNKITAEAQKEIDRRAKIIQTQLDDDLKVELDKANEKVKALEQRYSMGEINDKQLAEEYDFIGKSFQTKTNIMMNVAYRNLQAEEKKVLEQYNPKLVDASKTNFDSTVFKRSGATKTTLKAVETGAVITAGIFAPTAATAYLIGRGLQQYATPTDKKRIIESGGLFGGSNQEELLSEVKAQRKEGAMNLLFSGIGAYGMQRQAARDLTLSRIQTISESEPVVGAGLKQGNKYLLSLQQKVTDKQGKQLLGYTDEGIDTTLAFKVKQGEDAFTIPRKTSMGKSTIKYFDYVKGEMVEQTEKFNIFYSGRQGPLSIREGKVIIPQQDLKGATGGGLIFNENKITPFVSGGTAKTKDNIIKAVGGKLEEQGVFSLGQGRSFNPRQLSIIKEVEKQASDETGFKFLKGTKKPKAVQSQQSSSEILATQFEPLNIQTRNFGTNVARNVGKSSNIKSFPFLNLNEEKKKESILSIFSTASIGLKSLTNKPNQPITNNLNSVNTNLDLNVNDLITNQGSIQKLSTDSGSKLSKINKSKMDEPPVNIPTITPPKPSLNREPPIPIINLPILQFTFPGEKKPKPYDAFVRVDATKKNKAKWVQVANDVDKQTALSIAGRITDNSISRKFKIVEDTKVRIKPEKWEKRNKDYSWGDIAYKFRDFVVKTGTKLNTQNQFIEKSQFALDTPKEKGKIQSSKRLSSLLGGGSRRKKRFRL